MLTTNIGPLALSTAHLLLIASLLLATLTGWLTSRRHGRNPEQQLFCLLLVGAVVARASFVLAYLEHYRDDPWGMLDIRDGGFLVWPGIAAVLVGGLWIAWRDRGLRRPLGTALAVGLVAWGLSSYALHAYQQGTRMPQIALQDLAGEPVQLSDFIGKPIVVNLWATWCPPCRREMPVLAEAQQRETDLVFLFINQGESHTEIEHFLSVTGLQLDNLLLDHGSHLSQRLGSRALPTTLFYDAEGRQLDSHLGELSSASLQRMLNHLNEVAQPPVQDLQ